MSQMATMTDEQLKQKLSMKKPLLPGVPVGPHQTPMEAPVPPSPTPTAWVGPHQTPYFGDRAALSSAGGSAPTPPPGNAPAPNLFSMDNNPYMIGGLNGPLMRIQTGASTVPVSNGYMRSGGQKGPEFDPMMPHSQEPGVEQASKEAFIKKQIADEQWRRSAVMHGMTTEQIARGADLRESRFNQDMLSKAVTAPQAIQSAGTIQSAHTDLGAQGQAIAEKLRQDSAAKLASEDPTVRAQGQKDLEDSMRMGASFDKSFGGNLSEDEIKQRIAGQTALNTRETTNQKVGQSYVDWRRSLAAPFARAGYEGSLAAAQIPAAEGKAKISAYGAAKTATDVAGGDPSIQGSLVGAGRSTAEAGAIKAETAKKIEEKKSLTANTPGAIPPEVKTDAYQKFGIDENYGRRIAEATTSMQAMMSDARTGRVAGGDLFGRHNERHNQNISGMLPDVQRLEDMAAMSPDFARVAAQKAQEILTPMPKPQPDGTFRVAQSIIPRGAGVGIAAQQMQLIYDRLQKIIEQAGSGR